MISTLYINLSVGQYQTIDAPAYSKIVDISIDQYGGLIVLYEHKVEYSTIQHKQFIIFIVDGVDNIQENTRYIGDNFKFFGKIEKYSPTSILGNGKIDTFLNKEIYYVFIEEIKSVDELRDENINKVLS